MYGNGIRSEKTKDTKRNINQKDIDPYTRDIEEQLMRSLGTKVNLIKGDKIGKIEIEYYGEEDLKGSLKY